MGTTKRRRLGKRLVHAQETVIVRRFIAFLFFIGFALPAAAQSNCSANGANSACSTGNLAISITIGRAVELSLSSASTALTQPSVADYDIGYVTTVGPTGTVRANVPWSLSISTGSATWNAVNTQTEPARTNKPASDLAWSLVAGGPFTDLSTTPVTMFSGNCTTDSGVTGTLYYRTRYDWTLDTPGTYSIQVILTITSP